MISGPKLSAASKIVSLNFILLCLAFHYFLSQALLNGPQDSCFSKTLIDDYYLPKMSRLDSHYSEYFIFTKWNLTKIK